MTLSTDRVVQAREAWTWWPDNAVVASTGEFRVVRFPDHFPMPLVLQSLTPDGSTSVALERALAAAGEFGLPAVECWVKLGAPADLEELYRARGGVLSETLDVLALDLTTGLPDLDVPTDVTLDWVTDLDAARGAAEVGAAAFGGEVPPDEELVADVSGRAADVEDGVGAGLLARLGGLPAGSGGVTMAGGVARLWNGAVAPAFRGRGVYRALLNERLRYATEHAGELALVTARVETSGPTLRRAGFTSYGRERAYTLPL